MTKLLIKIAFVLSMLLVGVPQVVAQNSPDEIDWENVDFSEIDTVKIAERNFQQDSIELADSLLYGINMAVDYSRAFAIYQNLVAQDNEEAMNSLAAMYQNGFGVVQNFDSAVYLYHKAANISSGKAAFNLANMYRQGEGVAMNYAIAYEYFLKSFELGYSLAAYSLGYCHFKGFGVPQDYTKALEFFNFGAAEEYENCIYFAALCYVGGFGTTQNITKGMEMMQQAMELGSDPASAFIAENKVQQYLPTGLRATRLQRPYRRVANEAKDQLSGEWQGTLLNYDWSGTQIESSNKLVLDLTFRNDSLTGTWLQDDSISISVSGHLEDSLWVFDNMQYIDTKLERPWLIQSGGFQIVAAEGKQPEMEGSIGQYSPQTKEPAPPASLVLTRSAGSKKDPVDQALRNSLAVQPNPFDRELQVSIKLGEEQNLTLRVYDVEGQTAYRATRRYAAGSHLESLKLDVPKGAYVVSIKGAGVNLQTLVIKK